jgi:aerobic carbon-monoxide dehydrogenase small subunit
MTDFELTVNGRHWAGSIEPRTLLVHLLRDTLHLTGTKIGCDTAQCGACTVLIDGRSAKACTLLAVQCHGAEVQTIEAEGDQTLYRLRDAFHRHHALQCGYCTAGMVMSARSLIDALDPSASRDDVREGMRGNMCRCTGYQNIVDAIADVAGLRDVGHAGGQP